MSGTKTALVLTLISLLPISANRIIALEKAGIHVADRHLFVNYDYRPFDAENWSPLPSVLLGPARLQLVRQAYRLILRRR